MAEIKDGGPAFPSHGTMGEVVQDGMSLRDYFAAKVMQSCLIRSQFDNDPDETIAKRSYRIADAMLKAREVQNG